MASSKNIAINKAKKTIEFGQTWHLIYNNVVYTFHLKEVHEKHVILETAEKEFRLDLKKTKNLDYNKDGKDDIEIRLDKINYGREAEITFKLLHQQKLSSKQTPSPTIIIEDKLGTLWYLILPIILILAFLCLYLLHLYRHEKRSKKQLRIRVLK